MKKVFSILGIALISAFVIFNSGCSKKEGCTDVDATNYDTEADKSCSGCCTYKGTVVIWYGQATANNLVNDGSTSLTYYVDNQVVGSSSANIYFTSSPDCGQNGSITVEKDLGNLKQKSFSYKVMDDLGDIIWQGNIDFDATKCTALELTWTN